MSETLLALFSPAGAAWIVPLAALVVAHFVAEPLRWQLYLRGSTPGGLMRLVHIFSLTAFIGYTMPLKMGLPVRVLLLRSRAEVSLGRISSLLILDGLLYYVMWGLAACGALLAFAGRLELSAEMTLGLAGAALALVGLLGGWLAWLRPREREGVAGEGRAGTRLSDALRQRIAGLRMAARETDAGAVRAAAAIAALDIVSHVLRHGALLAVCGVSLEPGALALVACVSVFVGLVSLMPMGLGGYDVTLVLLLTQLGVVTEVAILVAVMNRVVTIVVGSALGVWGGFALGLHPLRRDWMSRTGS